ncbi:MAG: DUF3810 domain-containing protein [Ruminococcaceae bacterium]|nr:DUF3810 domain-containing protein [Oscillospiraceae bacterium]
MIKKWSIFMVNEKKEVSFWAKIRNKCPTFSLVFFGLCLLAIPIHIICVLSTGFADFYNTTVGAFVRAVLAYLTKYLPFSLAETIIICLPLILVILIVISVKSFKKSDLAATRCVVGMFSVLTFMYSVFVLGYGMGYHGSSLANKLGLEEVPVTAGELKYTAEQVYEEMEPLLKNISYTQNGESVMPYSLDVMNDKLNEAYKKACKKYDFIQDLDSNLKYVVFSEPMTYTHISGVYSYYTGEANLNINFPDYTLPFTAAHELAHQRGIAPENEANFVAFLVCMESDDNYIRYSAYLNMYEYLTNALYSADSSMYKELWSKTDDRARGEMIAFSRFFDKYRDSTASKVTNVVNDTYLKTQGQSAGTKSYGMVVDLAVAYYKQK